MTLMVAIFAMVLLSTTTVALLVLSASEPTIAHNLLHGVQAFYVAESGLEIALCQLNQGMPLMVLTGPVGVGTYTITVQPVDPDHVLVRSVGQVETATRTVSNTFERDAEGVWHPMKQFREMAP